ncbi:hypothetical protein F3087_18265 [Nocardia colli]|uniref:Uncharacterized protein n=1 Tax=Nocardia colli TaxID=2545717 RepID=A0A5N0EHN5_9NOCA|nr:hypothetical protein [Nocardia colli]KAA8887605.1 hypothetical protein F3087_18265 [Nocardia colli]
MPTVAFVAFIIAILVAVSVTRIRTGKRPDFTEVPSFWRPVAVALVVVTIAAVIMRIADNDLNPRYGSVVWSVALSGIGCAILLTALTDVRSRRTASSVLCAVVGIAFGLWSLFNGPSWNAEQAMRTDCADSAASYRVIAVADQPEQCPATAAPCDMAGAQRPSSVVTDVATTDMCPNGGYMHAARRYTVCTDLRTEAPRP